MLKFLINNYIDNSILKDILWLKILWTWIKVSANSFIKTLVNIMKRKWTTRPWKLSLAKKKNASPHFKEHCTKMGDISLVVIRFLFSQTNLVFKSNAVFIDILDSFCHSLLTFLPFFYRFWSSSNASMPCLQKSVKFWWVRCSFCKVTILKMFLCLISMKCSFNTELRK